MSHTKPLPEITDAQAFQNTDREVWRETPGDFYSNSVHLTATGGLGINVGGTVYVKPPAEWHRLASGARSTAAQPADAVEQEIVVRYVVEKRSGGGFWPYCVRAGDGARELFVGHKKACEQVRAALESACLDGAFMARSALGRGHHG